MEVLLLAFSEKTYLAHFLITSISAPEEIINFFIINHHHLTLPVKYELVEMIDDLYLKQMFGHLRLSLVLSVNLSKFIIILVTLLIR